MTDAQTDAPAVPVAALACCQDARGADCCRCVAAGPLPAVTPATRHAARVAEALAAVPWEHVDALTALIRAAQARGALVLAAGNGGSAALASHFAADLQSVGVRAVALCDSAPRLTALANDEAYAAVFARQVETLADTRRGDVLVLISSSGLSPNVTSALWYAQHAPVACVFGERGRATAHAATCAVVVPSDDYEVIEDVTSVVLHAVKKALRDGR